MTTTPDSIPSRLRSAAALAATRWDPHTFGIVDILARVAHPVGRPDATDLQDAVARHLGGQRQISPFELHAGRTRAEVAAMLRAAADQAEVSA